MPSHNRHDGKRSWVWKQTSCVRQGCVHAQISSELLWSQNIVPGMGLKSVPILNRLHLHRGTPSRAHGASMPGQAATAPEGSRAGPRRAAQERHCRAAEPAWRFTTNKNPFILFFFSRQQKYAGQTRSSRPTTRAGPRRRGVSLQKKSDILFIFFYFFSRQQKAQTTPLPIICADPVQQLTLPNAESDNAEQRGPTSITASRERAQKTHKKRVELYFLPALLQIQNT